MKPTKIGNNTGFVIKGPVISNGELDRFVRFIGQKTGLKIAPLKPIDLRKTLDERLKAAETSINEYFKLISAPNSKEFGKLLDLITVAVGETSFFKMKKQFSVLESDILPGVIERNTEFRTLRIWSAGCSTGEEPYTIAMILLDKFPAVVNYWEKVEILATDINKRAIKTAEEGKFEEYSLRNTPEIFRNKYFSYDSNQKVYNLKDNIKQLVKFKVHNLIEKSIYENYFDIVSCRNVIIYFTDEGQKKALKNIYESLKDKGVLFPGHSEILQHIEKRFTVKLCKGVFVYIK